MQGDVQNISDDYQKRLEALFRSHERRMARAQKSFELAVAKAGEQLRVTMEEPQPEPERDVPLAIWSKSPNGEDVLILNREAAIMQMALLEQIGEVFKELSKLTPAK